MSPDVFRPDAALIPLMSEDMLLAFDLHPTLELTPQFSFGCMPGKMFTYWVAMPRWPKPGKRCPTCGTDAPESRFGAPCYDCVPSSGGRL